MAMNKVLLGEHVAASILAEGRRRQELKLLRGAASGTLPREITQDSSEYSYDVLAELCHADLMIATKQGRLVNPYFHSMKITHAGRDYLASLEQQGRADNAPAAFAARGDKKDWSDKPVGKIAIGVAIVLLGAAALAGIAHWWSVLTG